MPSSLSGLSSQCGTGYSVTPVTRRSGSRGAPLGLRLRRSLLSAGRPRPGILSRNSGIGLLGPRSHGASND
ncbi:MAG: hypothetical protein NTW91_09710 [Verrucomicrobia bacterium]|nr:hypothetical protein [Verrucomicrobiota bacterium]